MKPWNSILLFLLQRPNPILRLQEINHAIKLTIEQAGSKDERIKILFELKDKNQRYHPLCCPDYVDSILSRYSI